ncbi:MAG: adenylate/guanylate cyclase domain-containing protein, partial [Nitrosopumilaceae archaeon]
YVLKFVGDSVIGYFVTGENSLLAADSAVNCAKSMMSVVSEGINPILNEYDYPDLIIKIGIDYGDGVVVQYGATSAESHIDLLGPVMSIASKIQDRAKPNQILVGEDVYTRLHPTLKKSFKEVQWKENEWKFHDKETGKLYPVFSYVKQ